MQAAMYRGIGEVVIVTASSCEAQLQGLNMAGKTGKVCFFAGLPKDNPHIMLDANLLHYKQITLYGAFSSAPRHNKLALNIIAGGQISADKIVTHIVSLERIKQGMDVVTNSDGLKVVVAPHFDDMKHELSPRQQVIL